MAKLYIIFFNFFGLLLASDLPGVLQQRQERHDVLPLANDVLQIDFDIEYKLNTKRTRVLSLMDLSLKKILDSGQFSKVMKSEIPPDELKNRLAQCWCQRNFAKLNRAGLISLAPPLLLSQNVKSVNVLSNDSNDSLVVSLDDGTLKVFNYKTQSEFTLNCDCDWSRTYAKVLEDGNILIGFRPKGSHHQKNVAVILDSKTGEKKFKIEYSGRKDSLAALNNEIVAISTDGKCLNIFSMDTGEVLRSFCLERNDHRILSLKILPNKNILLVLESPSYIRDILIILDLSCKIIVEKALSSNWKLLDVLSDGSVVVQSENGREACIDICTRRTCVLGRTQRKHRKDLNLETDSLRRDPSLERAILRDDRLLRVAQRSFLKAKLLPNKNILIFLPLQREIEVYDFMGQLKHEFKLEGAPDPLNPFLKILEDGRIFIAYQNSSELEIWDFFKGELICKCNIQEKFSSDIISLKVLPNGDLAVLLKDGKLKILRFHINTSCINMNYLCELDSNANANNKPVENIRSVRSVEDIRPALEKTPELNDTATKCCALL